MRPPPHSPARLLLWQAARQPWTLVAGMAFGIGWMLCQVAWPYLLGRAIDAMTSGGVAGVAPWCAALGVLAGLQALLAALRHRMAVSNWLRSSLSMSRIVGHHTADTGSAIVTETSSGEVASAVASDALRVGEMFDVTARFTGGVAAYLAVGVVSLALSVPIGLVMLVGMPVVLLILSLFLRTLRSRQAIWRTEQGALADLAADTVAGLRVLRGVGGERAFSARYARRSQLLRERGVSVARLSSWLDALQIVLPGLFVAAIVWLGARLVLAGSASPGELVTLYGYAVFLVVPLRTAVEATLTFSRGFVAAGRVVGVLGVRRAVTDDADPQPAPASGAGLRDVASGATFEPGRLTALVSEHPDDAARIAERLGRFDDREHRDAPVLWGGVDHTRVAVRDVRRRIVVNGAVPHLFTGRLRDGLDIRGASDRPALQAALDAAAADDAVRSLPDGLDGEVPERGSVFSGGQRQRLSLARVLAADPEVLVLVEPTSALDAHTEAIVAGRLREARAGRTTVVVTESPLLLDAMDTVHVLGGDRVVASGSHEELMRRTDEPARRYRAVVARAVSDAEPDPAAGGAPRGPAWTGAIDLAWRRAERTGAIPTPPPPKGSRP